MEKNITDDNDFGKFSFGFSCFKLVFCIILSIYSGGVISNLFGVSLLEGSVVLSVLKQVFFYSLGFFIWYNVAFPIFRGVEIYTFKWNKYKFEVVTGAQSKKEHFGGMICLFVLIILAIVYSYYPHPAILSLSLLFGAVLAFVWLLHRARERQLANTLFKKSIFYVSEFFTLGAIITSYIICQVMVSLKFVEALSLDLAGERALNYFQFAEAVLLGFILALLCEWLANKFPVICLTKTSS